MLMPKVAISDDFLTAFAALPKKAQKKVREFTQKFRTDPTSSAVNYEPLHEMRDQKVRSVRIGDDYRAIVIHPPKGDVYMLVWVDHHDEAMAWARRKTFDVNPATGAFQVYEVEDVEAPRPPVPQAPARAESVPLAEHIVPAGRLLAGIEHDDLIILGVPEPLLPAVRALRTEADLVELRRFLPADAADALFLLAESKDPNAVLAELDRKKAAEKIDTEDFAAALERPESKRSFKVVEGERELLDMLSKPLELWRIFLHPTQRKLVEQDAKGSVRVLGGAGTGKTVVAMHRARHVARQLSEQPDKKVLVTTFTKNLAADISRNLDELCTEDERASIEVVHLHRWANQLLSSQGLRFDLNVDAKLEGELWDEAVLEDTLELSQAFYRDEWKFVVQANDIVDVEGYAQASRNGRGTRLSRRQKAAVWKVFAAYRAGLERRGKNEQSDIVRESRLYLERNPGAVPYATVIADEVQDFRTADLRLLRAMVPEGPADLFLVGDAHQRIYGHKASLGSVGINIRGRRSRRLRVNYRTTEKIRNFAVALLEGVTVDDLDDGVDAFKGYHSIRTGEPPEIHCLDTEQAEADFIVAKLKTWLASRPARDLCLSVRRKKLIEDRYRPLLEQAGIPVVVVSAEAEAALGNAVRLCTMHRMKGLEFPCVLLAAFNDGELPVRLRSEHIADQAADEDHILAERCLAHVAATRARDELVVTSFGKPSPLLAR
jgi:mRNA-degrading endonuclease RelE of RelBE toxin-antitoxin system